MKSQKLDIRVESGVGRAGDRVDLRPHHDYVAINGDYRS